AVRHLALPRRQARNTEGHDGRRERVGQLRERPEEDDAWPSRAASDPLRPEHQARRRRALSRQVKSARAARRGRREAPPEPIPQTGSTEPSPTSTVRREFGRGRGGANERPLIASVPRICPQLDAPATGVRRGIVLRCFDLFRLFGDRRPTVDRRGPAWTRRRSGYSVCVRATMSLYAYGL